jgi:hypothetical protein
MSTAWAGCAAARPGNPGKAKARHERRFLNARLWRRSEKPMKDGGESGASEPRSSAPGATVTLPQELLKPRTKKRNAIPKATASNALSN